MTKSPDKLNQVILIKSISPIIFSWSLIALSVYISSRINLLYPLALLVIINRIMTLGLLTHEAIHGNISKNDFINSFLGKYFCALPVYISFERWKVLHLMHHRFIGTSADPDLYLYQYYPRKLKYILLDFLSGKLIYLHFVYFTDFGNKKFKTSSGNKARFEFLFFHLAVIAIFLYFNIFKYYVLYWMIPFIFCIPLTLLYNCLEHFECYLNLDLDKRNRTILTSSPIHKLLLPLNVQYHGEHHLAPNVPQYNLSSIHDEIKTKTPELLYYEHLAIIIKKLFK